MVVQDPHNRAVRDEKGRFVMYINDRLIAYSEDLLHWESHELDAVWPGGECSVAIAHYDPKHADHLILFTGGNHTGHFYAEGEVLFSLKDAEHPLEWLPRPILAADASIPYEDGYAAEPPHQPISSWRDTIFICGMTSLTVNGMPIMAAANITPAWQPPMPTPEWGEFAGYRHPVWNDETGKKLITAGV